MNKKVIIIIAVCVAALAIIIGAIAAIISGLHMANDPSSSSPDASNSEIVSTESGDQTGDSSNGSSASAGSSGQSSVGTTVAGVVSGSTGSTVSVPVRISGNPGIAAGQFYFTYDADALAYLDYEEGDLLDEYGVNESGGTVVCIISTSDITRNVTGDGTLITLNFKIRDGAAKGSYKITVGDKTLISNIDEETVTPTIELSTIEVQ